MGSLINVSFKEKFVGNVEVGENSFCEFFLSPTTTSKISLLEKGLSEKKLFNKCFF